MRRHIKTNISILTMKSLEKHKSTFCQCKTNSSTLHCKLCIDINASYPKINSHIKKQPTDKGNLMI